MPSVVNLSELAYSYGSRNMGQNLDFVRISRFYFAIIQTNMIHLKESNLFSHKLVHIGHLKQKATNIRFMMEEEVNTTLSAV